MIVKSQEKLKTMFMHDFGGTRKDIMAFLKKAYSASFLLDTRKIFSRWGLVFCFTNMEKKPGPNPLSALNSYMI